MNNNEDKFLITGIYARVSTEEQAKEGFSINAQREKLKQYASARDWDIYDYYIDDGISGKNIKDRPEINRMLQDIEDGKINNVLVYKIDRLTRSTKNLIELIDLFNEKNCAFNSLMESIDTSSATGRMFIKIVGIFAEFERENLAERVSFGFEQKTREGNYTNTHGVYGYDYIVGEGKLVINEDERKLIEYIYSEYLSGTSMTEISRNLIAKNTPTKRGGKWQQSTIVSILQNPLYIGKVRYGTSGKKNNSFEVDSNHEPIISEDDFYAVQNILAKRRKYEARKYPTENSVFMGALICDKCGMQIGTSQHCNTNNGGSIYINYICYNRRNGDCTAPIFSQTKMDAAFLSYMSNIENFQVDENDFAKEEKEKKKIKLEQIKQELLKTEKRLDEIRALFTQEKITFEEYRAFSDDMRKKTTLLEEEMNALIPQDEELDFEQIKDIIGNVQLNWGNLTNTEKSEFIYRFIDSIKVYSDNGNIIITDMQFAKAHQKQKQKKISKK